MEQAMTMTEPVPPAHPTRTRPPKLSKQQAYAARVQYNKSRNKTKTIEQLADRLRCSQTTIKKAIFGWSPYDY